MPRDPAGTRLASAPPAGGAHLAAAHASPATHAGLQPAALGRTEQRAPPQRLAAASTALVSAVPPAPRPAPREPAPGPPGAGRRPWQRPPSATGGRGLATAPGRAPRGDAG